MAFPLGRDEWWLCQQQNCTQADRASLLESQTWIYSWLQELRSELRTDLRRMCLLQNLVRDIRAATFDLHPDGIVRQIEALIIFGRLHVHQKRFEVRSGTGGDAPSAAFPLANRQPRIASQPPPMVDAPVFAPNIDMSAQAAALMAAAASGTPFCQE